MSYQYVRSTAKQKDSIAGEQPIDLKGMTLKDLMEQYSLVKIIYHDSIFNQDYLLDTDFYFTQWSQTTTDIIGWLAQQEGLALKHLPASKSKMYYVKAGDLQLYNYRLYPGDHSLNADSQSRLDVDNAPDIRVQHPTLQQDWASFAKCGLFTVNGHFTQACGFNDALYLAGAGNNFRVNNNVHVQCLDFTNVATFNTYDFSKVDITLVSDQGYNGLHLNLNQDITNKEVWLVIAGRLVFGPQLIRRMGGSFLKVDLDSLQLPDKLFESLNYIDLSPTINKDRKIITPDELNRVEFIKGLLLNVNSFFIVFDTPSVGVTITPLTTYKYPSVLQCNDRFQHPLLLSNGLFPAYRTRYQDNTCLLDIDMRLQPTRVNDTTGLNNGSNYYHAYRDLYDPTHMVLGYSFKIHTLRES